MAAPSIDYLPSMESLRLSTLDTQLSRWSSSSSISTSSSSTSASRSTSSTGCPRMSKSLTDSMSSDTQTENETPPESPGEGTPCLQTTPIIRDASPRPILDYPCRPSLREVASHISLYSEPGEDSDGQDAGYETETEGKHAKSPLVKKSAARRNLLDRKTFRRRGERPASGLQNRFLSGTHIPTASHLATFTCPPSPNPNSNPRRSSLSRPGGPTKIALPTPSPPTFPKSNKKSPIGLGLGLGLPSTLSAVRLAPNCAHRSNMDPIVSPPRSVVPVMPSDLLRSTVDAFPPVPMPTKPRLNPISSPLASEIMSPLELSSPLLLDAAAPPPGAPIQPRHVSFCFSRGADIRGDLDNSVRRMAAGAFLAIADHAQLHRTSVSRAFEGPPTRGSQLHSTPEEVCEGDEARGIRRFEAVNPYFPATGYCVTSG